MCARLKGSGSCGDVRLPVLTMHALWRRWILQDLASVDRTRTPWVRFAAPQPAPILHVHP